MIRYYVRVSSMEQKINHQLIAYNKADFIYIYKMTGKSREHPELQRMLKELQPNDFVAVKSVDRLSRSKRDMLELIDTIKSKIAFLKILDMKIDTNTPQGEFFMTVVGGTGTTDN